MGALVSRKYDLIYDEVHGVKKYRGEFEAIGLLQKEVGLLFEFFKLIDIDNSGSIMLLELTEFIELEESSFAKKAFRAFDLDKSKTIDFHEFVLAVWDYCTLSRDNLALFAFSLYDADDSGMIDKKEMEKMLKDLYGNQYKDSPHAMALYNRLAEMQQKYIDEPFFVDFARTHPAMLYPATVLQIKLRERVLSEKFWADQLRKRNQRFKGKYVSIKQIIRSTGRKNSFDEDGEFLAQLDQKVLKEALGERFSNRPPCSKPNNQGAQDASNKAGPAREDRRKSSVDIRKPPPAFDHPPFQETIDNRSTSDSSSWSAKSETTSGKLKNQRRGSSKVKPHSDGTKPLPPDAAGW
ncbi:unnamed protein product [Symbiodinium microadriaticum]|nr:unnamed protein product [Symbiodinium microadriaticum]